MKDTDLLKELLVVINVSLVFAILIVNIIVLFIGDCAYESVIIGETVCVPIANLIAILVWSVD